MLKFFETVFLSSPTPVVMEGKIAGFEMGTGDSFNPGEKRLFFLLFNPFHHPLTR